MELKNVESSMIQAVGYNEGERVLEVVFSDGKRYPYRDVPKKEYEGLLAAESKGRYMQAHIIDHYPYGLERRRRP